MTNILPISTAVRARKEMRIQSIVDPLAVYGSIVQKISFQIVDTGQPCHENVTKYRDEGIA
jgi:hypothetical protein